MISTASGTDGARTMIGWKRRSSAPSFSMYFRYSSSVVAPMRLDLAARERRLEHVRGVDGALGGAGADERVQLVQEEDTFSDCRISFMTALSRSSNWPRYFVPATRAPRSSWSSRLCDEHVRHVVVDDLLGEALDDGRLAHAGLADQDRVVLRAAGEDLDDPLDLGLAADHRVELALAGELGQVARELVEDGRLASASWAAGSTGRRGGPASPGAPRRAGRRATRGSWPRSTALPSSGRGAGARCRCSCARAGALPRCDSSSTRLACGRERHLAERERLREPGQRPLDLALDGLEAEPEALEDRGRDALPVADQPEQDVLGPHEVVAEPARLLAGQDDDPSRTLGESFEHCGLLQTRRPAPGARASALTSTSGALSPTPERQYTWPSRRRGTFRPSDRHLAPIGPPAPSKTGASGLDDARARPRAGTRGPRAAPARGCGWR